jgi:hypothetical protein
VSINLKKKWEQVDLIYNSFSFLFNYLLQILFASSMLFLLAALLVTRRKSKQIPSNGWKAIALGLVMLQLVFVAAALPIAAQHVQDKDGSYHMIAAILCPELYLGQHIVNPKSEWPSRTSSSNNDEQVFQDEALNLVNRKEDNEDKEEHEEMESSQHDRESEEKEEEEREEEQEKFKEMKQEENRASSQDFQRNQPPENAKQDKQQDKEQSLHQSKQATEKAKPPSQKVKKAAQTPKTEPPANKKALNGLKFQNMCLHRKIQLMQVPKPTGWFAYWRNPFMHKKYREARRQLKKLDC